MNNKGLTISVIFEAESANYGEGFGNIAVLKKMSRGDGNTYSYISRQALRYSLVNQAKWDNTPVHEEQKVVQYEPTATIANYPEIDLFGYMKTSKKKDDKAGGASTRNAVARLSNAISLEPYNADLDFLTNMGLAKRKNYENAIAQSEIHKSYYAYSLTIDLDSVGVDTNDNSQISQTEKANRVNTLLNTIRTLYRDIRGRRETLSPIFVVGGIYDIKNPFFENRLKVVKNKLNIELLKSSMEEAGANTKIGYLDGMLGNSEQIKTLNSISIAEFFKKISEEITEYYG